MAEREYYEVLGVERTAPPEEIKRAYRRVAMQYHPDRNPDDPAALEKFREATRAYEILHDPETRGRYDQFGHAGVGAAGGGGGFGDFDLSDALRAFMRDFGGFEDLFGRSRGRGGRSRGPLKGSDVQTRLRVSLEEVAGGVEKTIRVKLLQRCDACHGKGTASGELATCPTCQGGGEVRQAQRSIFGQFVSVHVCPRCEGEGKIVIDPCKSCGGEGRIREDKRIKVRIPAGVESGNYLTLRGEGNVGPRGGPQGDLLIVIEVETHPLFERSGDDVLLDLGISFPQAALGAAIEVPTLNGPATLEVPAGTQSGDVLRLPGRGIPRLGGGPRGDQLAQISVWVPTRLSPEERRAVEALVDSENFVPPKSGKGFWGKVREAFTT
ncbi:MAG TPA: molecular chaperone DnaJ [Gemmatimonadota bacterium]|nr:molecular chaperone DnaJ [Gemmatimonadota bacterium]